jgi:hypothetical protein
MEEEASPPTSMEEASFIPSFNGRRSVIHPQLQWKKKLHLQLQWKKLHSSTASGEEASPPTSMEAPSFIPSFNGSIGTASRVQAKPTPSPEPYWGAESTTAIATQEEETMGSLQWSSESADSRQIEISERRSWKKAWCKDQ